MIWSCGKHFSGLSYRTFTWIGVSFATNYSTLPMNLSLFFITCNDSLSLSLHLFSHAKLLSLIVETKDSTNVLETKACMSICIYTCKVFIQIQVVNAKSKIFKIGLPSQPASKPMCICSSCIFLMNLFNLWVLPIRLNWRDYTKRVQLMLTN